MNAAENSIKGNHGAGLKTNSTGTVTPVVDVAKQLYGPIAGNRWVQLVAGLIAMIVISNYQYAFTLFQPGIQATFKTTLPPVAAIFSLFVLFETWPVPVAGYLIDRFGIRRLMLIGAAMILLGWLLSGIASPTIDWLYLYYGFLAGTGAGMIYVSCVGNAVKWFPDRRGLAAGITAAGFGGGAALTVIPVSFTISSYGWQSAIAIWGVIQGIIAIAMALILRHPPKGWAPANWHEKAETVTKRVVQTPVDYPWYKVLARPEFWILYVMFLFVATGGLMTTGNLSAIAKSLGVANAKVLGLAIVPLTVTLTGITNALARIMWGSISDRLGRELTMTIAFVLEGVLILLVTQITGRPELFVLLLPFVFLSWGEIFALFSAITGDIFGPKNATNNYGMLYTAKGLSSILAGYGAAVIATYYGGSFIVPYYIAAIFDILAAVLGITALRYIVRRRIARERAQLVTP